MLDMTILIIAGKQKSSMPFNPPPILPGLVNVGVRSALETFAALIIQFMEFYVLLLLPSQGIF